MTTNIPIANAKKSKLLIFADENNMQAILAEALMPEKFQLEFASKESIGNTDEFKPQLIVLDHSSAPLSSEKNLCEKLKASFPTVPLIVLSAYPLNNFSNYSSHIDLFIAKPFDLNYFLTCVESYLIAG